MTSTEPKTYKVLRVFFSLYTKGAQNSYGQYHWKREKQHYDYAPDMTPEAATEDIIKQYGDRPSPSGAHHRSHFAVVHSHMLIPDLPVAEFKGWRAFEVPLFDGLTLKACQSVKPGSRKKIVE